MVLKYKFGEFLYTLATVLNDNIFDVGASIRLQVDAVSAEMTDQDGGHGTSLTQTEKSYVSVSLLLYSVLTERMGCYYR